MVRFECSLIIWIVTLALSTAMATVRAQEGEQGPPSNLKAGHFQSVVDGMWRDSATFRQQCQRWGAQPGLMVTVVPTCHGREPPHARRRRYAKGTKDVRRDCPAITVRPRRAIAMRLNMSSSNWME